MASVAVEFGQIDVIDAFVYAVSAVDGADIDNFEWMLTEDSAAEKTRHVRTLAVQDAVEKAEVYARSVGRTAMTALAVADPGLLGVGATQPDFAAAARAYKGADDGFDLKPQDIVIRAQVHARFAAS
ncbi:MAG: SIMPL domain-containing protein [Rhodococcus sp. (in: high G+C Gram-positive bacteria)]